MSSIWSGAEATTLGGSRSQEFDDVEKGLFDEKKQYPAAPPLAYIDQKKPTNLHIETVFSPLSPIHEGLTPFSSVPELSLSWPAGWKAPESTTHKKLAAVKRKVSKLILVRLWFNTYRKFFTFVTLFNLTGIVLAALGRFPYAENHLGSLVLGNLLCAILMRNELFLRFLYTIAIYGLRSVGHIMSFTTTTTTGNADVECY
jgi:hypothetical protein